MLGADMTFQASSVPILTNPRSARIGHFGMIWILPLYRGCSRRASFAGCVHSSSRSLEMERDVHICSGVESASLSHITLLKEKNV